MGAAPSAPSIPSSVLKLVYKDEAVVVARPLGYKDAIAQARLHFSALGHDSMIVFRSDKLPMCEANQAVVISEQAWETLVNDDLSLVKAIEIYSPTPHRVGTAPTSGKLSSADSATLDSLPPYRPPGTRTAFVPKNVKGPCPW